MICQWCRDGGDSYWESVQSNLSDKIKKDLEGRSKALHAKCTDKGCFCQHRLRAVKG